MPLVWAHAEYLELVRSAADGQVFGLIPEVADRYRNPRTAPALEVWKLNRQAGSVPAGGTLRIQADSPFRLRWTGDQWNRVHDTDSILIATGHAYADIRVSPEQRAPLCFTFFWTQAGRWEGRDFQVAIDRRGSGGAGLAPAAETIPRRREHPPGGVGPVSAVKA